MVVPPLAQRLEDLNILQPWIAWIGSAILPSRSRPECTLARLAFEMPRVLKPEGIERSVRDLWISVLDVDEREIAEPRCRGHERDPRSAELPCGGERKCRGERDGERGERDQSSSIVLETGARAHGGEDV